jgi:hypothetical protein
MRRCSSVGRAMREGCSIVLRLEGQFWDWGEAMMKGAKLEERRANHVMYKFNTKQSQRVNEPRICRNQKSRNQETDIKDGCLFFLRIASWPQQGGYSRRGLLTGSYAANAQTYYK